MGIGKYDEWTPDKKIKILLVGYNGVRNTGSDVRVVEMARQLADLFGKDRIQITIMTMDVHSLEGYFDEDVSLLHFSTFFPFDLYRACNSHHAVILCEGSTLKSTFANALTLFLCEAAGIMQAQGKPCLAFGSEVGHMEPFLQRAAAQLCRDTWFITRTEGSFAELKKLGLHGHNGTDAAWFYQPFAAMENTLQGNSDENSQGVSQDNRQSSTQAGKQDFKQSCNQDNRQIINSALTAQGWDGKKKLIGISVIDPFCWPVRASISKWIIQSIRHDYSMQFDRCYFFSDSPDRRLHYRQYTEGIANGVNHFLQEHDYFPVLIGMERLDKKACLEVRSMLNQPGAIFLSGDHNASVMVGVLRSLSMLITSRYHAAVLSMENGCPIVAVSMDERLDGIMNELNMGQYLMHVRDEDIERGTFELLRNAEMNREDIHANIQEQLPIYKKTLSEMGEFMKKYIEDSLTAKAGESVSSGIRK